jgi:type IV secretion system protein VirB1
MPLDPTVVLALAAACAPQVSPDTMLSVVSVESGFDPYAIGVNGPGGRRLHPTTPEGAVRTAEGLLSAGRNVDLGLAQINFRNLGWLGLSLADAFDPCRNLAASAQVLVGDWRRSSRPAASAAAALGETLSRYNTGDGHRGFANGYVARVAGAFNGPARPHAAVAAPPAPGAGPPHWAVFGRRRAAASFVITPSDGALP